MIETNDSCSTKYPILFIHGLGFRDTTFYINYWGRIPKALTNKGARIYYGNNDAIGSIHNSAISISRKIDEILAELNCEKVNIIAHSKGGLDCRYLISSLGYQNKIASLTTIATPHHGSKILNIFNYLPKFLIHVISFFVNIFFWILGDKKPDFFTVSQEVSSDAIFLFNIKNKDNSQILYQSFGTRLSSPFNDILFFFTYIFLSIFEGENDGIVAFESSKWTNFSEIKTQKNNRGLSHADVVDYRRMNRFGLHIPDFYQSIIYLLKEKGL